MNTNLELPLREKTMPVSAVASSHVLYHVSGENIIVLAIGTEEGLKTQISDYEKEMNDDGEAEAPDMIWVTTIATGAFGSREREWCQPEWFSRDTYYAIQRVSSVL